MCKIIIAVFGAMLAGGIAYVLQGVGLGAEVSTCAMGGSLFGLAVGWLIGA